MSPGSTNPLRRDGPVAWAFAMSAVVGLFSLGLVSYLTQTLARPARLAGMPAEPETTGSIAAAGTVLVAAGARSVVLDPCKIRERLVVRGP